MYILYVWKDEKQSCRVPEIHLNLVVLVSLWDASATCWRAALDAGAPSEDLPSRSGSFLHVGEQGGCV